MNKSFINFFLITNMTNFFMLIIGKIILQYIIFGIRFNFIFKVIFY